MRNPPSNSDDTLNSRDLIEHLENLRDQVESQVPDLALDKIKAEDVSEYEEESPDLEEYIALRDFCAEAKDYADDWHHGATLIRESYFTRYAKELADDIGAINGNEGWPLNWVDWAAAARELKQDYTEIEWNGVTYYVR